MLLTNHQAKYFAHDLTRQASSEGLERLSMALFDSNVDLNPHQIEAALFALRSPISKGVILADEVGLGKTIEASLVLSQLWAERKRRLMVVCPASLRKQWANELEDKFNLPSIILDSRSYNNSKKRGAPNPFECGKVVICSMNFAARMKNDIRAVGWHLVVIDEAHKLRNAHQPSNKTGQAIRFALQDSRKLLLTATPLQNSLMELYGMSSVIDEFMFGEASTFRALYTTSDADLKGLRDRLKGFCKRTLRRDVLEYIKYTQRQAITRPFSPSNEEHELYEAISAFLHRSDTYSIPARQRVLLTLRLRKILASSSPAIAGTLEIIRDRLIRMRSGLPEESLVDKIISGGDIEDEDLAEEFESSAEAEPDEPTIDVEKLDAEIQELGRYISWARSIGVDTKTRSLLNALQVGFELMEANGAKRKALVFTESRRTQEFVRNFLEVNGFAGKVVTFNGSNSDETSRAITARWVEANRDTGRVTGSRDVDARSAIIDKFRDDAEVMIATEAAAEGVNLQFCSLVVNYDLPWNPQRIEQRIGRCHRYGQKHDVVVINFVNERNAADQRTFELLEEKFQLFDGVFGVSDEVLGTIESGVDFERRIYDIYQSCRSEEEIESAFKELRDQLEDKIKSRMDSTRQLLLEFFDEDIHERLRIQLEGARSQLDRVGKQFWQLTKHVLASQADFNDGNLTFDLKGKPADLVREGTYHLISKGTENIDGDLLYRLSHPLGEHVVSTAKSCETPMREITFNVTSHPTKLSVVEDLRGQSGWLSAEKLVIEAFDREEHILLSAFTDSGASVDQEVLQKMLLCAGEEGDSLASPVPDRLRGEVEQHVRAALNRSLEANGRFMNEERERLERWADDMILSAERELRDIKAQLREANRLARQAVTMEEQVAHQSKIRDLEQRQRHQRQRIFEVEDEIIEKRDLLISALEKRMQQKSSTEELFVIRWSVV